MCFYGSDTHPILGADLERPNLVALGQTAPVLVKTFYRKPEERFVCGTKPFRYYVSTVRNVWL